MSDDERKSPHRKRWIIGIAILVLYVLSVGPAIGVVAFLSGPQLTPESLAILRIFYAPLRGLAELSDSFKSVMVWYADLFV